MPADFKAGTEKQAAQENSTEKLNADLVLTTSKYLMWLSAIVVVLLVVIWVFARRYTQLLVGSLAVLPVSLTAGYYPALHNKGRKRTGLIWLFGACMVALLVVPVVLPDITPAVAIGNLLVLTMVHLSMGNKDGRWFAAAGVIGIAVALALARTLSPRWFLPLQETLGIVLDASFGAIVLVAGILIVRIVVSQQESAFDQTKQANLRAEERATREQEQRQYLQTTVQRYVEYENRVAQGNLQARIAVEGNGQGKDDPLVALGNQLNATTEAMQAMIVQFRSAATALNQQGAEILATTTQQASGAAE